MSVSVINYLAARDRLQRMNTENLSDMIRSLLMMLNGIANQSH